MNKLHIRIRSVGRRLRLQKLYYRIFPKLHYEEKFHEAILDVLQIGDVVWDVGANDGFYARIFGEKTGAEGRVFAFEPTPESHIKLTAQTESYPWVLNELMALSDFDGTSALVVLDAHRRNHLLQGSVEATDGNGVPVKSVPVKVSRGDSYWTTCGITPDLIKIDVEGFEEEVLAGMNGLLAAPKVRAVFVEVHFRLLEERGRTDAPIRIEKLLRSKGLHPKWVDESHIAAIRIGAKTAASTSPNLRMSSRLSASLRIRDRAALQD